MGVFRVSGVPYFILSFILVTALWTARLTDAEPPPVSLRPPAHDPVPHGKSKSSGISTEMKFSIKPFTFKTSFDLSRDQGFNSKPPTSYSPLPPPPTYYNNPDHAVSGGYSYKQPISGGYSYKPTVSGGYSYKPSVSDGYSYKPPVSDGYSYKSPSYGYSYNPAPATSGYSYNQPPATSGYSYNQPPATSGYSYNDPVKPSYYQSSTYQPYQVSYESRKKGYSSYGSYSQVPAYKYDPWKPVYSPTDQYGEKPEHVKHIYLHSGKRKSEFPYKLILVNKNNPEESHEIHLPSAAPADPDELFYVVSKGWRNNVVSPYGLSREDNPPRDYYNGNRDSYGHAHGPNSESEYGSGY